jgi:hypothetical protein
MRIQQFKRLQGFFSKLGVARVHVRNRLGNRVKDRSFEMTTDKGFLGDQPRQSLSCTRGRVDVE